MKQPGDDKPDDDALAEALDEAVRSAGDGSADPEGLVERYAIDGAAAEALVAGVDAFEQALLGDEVALEFTPPDLPEDFEVLGEIGRGGMGVVYRARQKSLERDVAVKVLRPGALHFSGALDRFRLEARSLAKLRHRHIVAIHEIGEVAGDLFYSMDLIEGGSLADRLKGGPLGSAQSVRLMRQVVAAMAYTHGAGLVHRDLKPANVLLDPEGDAYVVDFGLARDIGWDGGLTSTGHLLGTPDYMSPEQARGDRARVGESSDIYGLGAILYACLTGVAPFEALPMADKIHRVVYELPVAPSKRNPKVPRDLETICSKAMSKRPEDRYVTARAMLEDLERFEQGRSILARRPTTVQLMRRAAGRHARELLVAAAVTILAGGFFWLALAGQRDRDLTRRLVDVRTLLDAGEGRAAAMMMEEVSELAAVDELTRKESLPYEHLRARCKMVTGNELRARGKDEAADEAFERAASSLSAGVARAHYSRGSGYPAIRFEMLADLVMAQVELNQLDKALANLARFQGGLVHEPQTERLLGWMAPRVADPSDAGHRAGVVILAHVLDWSTPGSFGTWLAERPDLACDIVEGMLSSLGDLDPIRADLVRQGLLRRNVLASPGLGLIRGRQENREVTLGNRIEERLALMAMDSDRPEHLRALACGVLVQLADLPLRLPGSPDDSRFDGDLVARILQGWEATRKAPDRRRALADWIRSQAGTLSAASLAEAAAWHETWFGSGLESEMKPDVWPPDGEARVQLESLQDLSALQVRKLHRHLERIAPPGSEVPPYPVRGTTLPLDVLQLSWRRALGPVEKEYRLSVAHFVYLEGHDTPRLAWTRTRDLAPGEELVLEVIEEDLHTVTRNRRSHDWMGVRTPTLRRARPGTFVLELEGQLELDGAGVLFDIDRLEYNLAVGGPKDGWSVKRAGEALLSGRVAALAVQEYGWPRHGTHTSIELVLGVIEPIDSAGGEDVFDPASIEAWRSRLGHELQADGERLLATAVDRADDANPQAGLDPAATWIAEVPRSLRVAITNQWILAGLLPLPDQLEILRSSSDALRRSGAFDALLDPDADFPECFEPGLSFERSMVQLGVARLAAGDSTVLEEEDLRPMLEDSSLTGAQWAHRVLDAPTEELRSFALARLDSKFTSDGLWRTLGRRSAEEGLTLPDWAQERVDQAPSNLRGEELRLAGGRIWVNGFHFVICLTMLGLLSFGRLSRHDRIGLAVSALLYAFLVLDSTFQIGPVVLVMAPFSIGLAWMSVNDLWQAAGSSTGVPDSEPPPHVKIGFSVAMVAGLVALFGGGEMARWFIRLGLLAAIAGMPQLLESVLHGASAGEHPVGVWLKRAVRYLFLPAGIGVLLATVGSSGDGIRVLPYLAEWSGVDLRSIEKTISCMIYIPVWFLLGSITVAGYVWSHRERELVDLAA